MNASKIFNRDVDLAGGSRLIKGDIVIVNAEGEVVAPIDVVNLTTSGNTTLGDSSADTLTVPSTATFNAPVTVQGQLTASAGSVLSTSTTINDFLILETSTRSGPGAIPQTAPACNLTTTGADALTLADGTVVNQILTITMVVDGGDGTLTPATPLGFATITFNSVGDSVILKWNAGLGWAILSNFGCTVA